MLALQWKNAPGEQDAERRQKEEEQLRGLVKSKASSQEEAHIKSFFFKSKHAQHHPHHGHKSRGHHHHKKDHRRSKRGKTELQQANGGTIQAGMASVCAIAAYGALRGGIKLFHHARRGMLRQLLFDLAPVMNGRYQYWVDFGSLLGIHRDGDLIPHDNDIDLAVLDPDWDELEEHLSKSLTSYSVKKVYPSECPEETTFMRVYCLLGFADIFGATEIDEGRLLVDCGHGEVNCIAKDLVVPTSSLEWRGVKIQVPQDLEGALQARYGPTWRIPRYMDKGADTVEGNKTYAKVFRALSRFGIRL